MGAPPAGVGLGGFVFLVFVWFSDYFAVTFAAEDLAVVGDISINMMKALEKKLS